ncbi:hypothetical protein [Algoriphagus aquimarinus]|uniref:hypothetical protein n=1 Tax=Algoriphagus aquimarinus TaxID=237018 RepID=UPI0030DBCD49|tara:strand:+ start:46009 stop:46716 length:708 start_codon:yes stop_codon:yes gene_type:complete
MKLNSLPVNDPSYLESMTEGVMWFSVRSKNELKRTVDRLKSEGITSLRLGIDCAEFNTKRGLKWYDWLVPSLAESFELELCFDNFSKASRRSACKKHSLLEIVEYFIHKHGQHFTLLELWRNPENRSNQDYAENIFAEDIVFVTTWAKHLGKKVSLGRIQTIDFEWITKLISSQFLQNIECVEIDKEEEDLWSSSTKFYERTLRSLFAAKGLKIEIRPSVKSPVNFQISTGDIAC